MIDGAFMHPTLYCSRSPGMTDRDASEQLIGIAGMGTLDAIPLRTDTVGGAIGAADCNGADGSYLGSSDECAARVAVEEHDGNWPFSLAA
jgi:hypothetical protein